MKQEVNRGERTLGPRDGQSLWGREASPGPGPQLDEETCAREKHASAFPRYHLLCTLEHYVAHPRVAATLSSAATCSVAGIVGQSPYPGSARLGSP